jgi:hypothetical protein|tara:strand:+ start:96 stop:245 length:150 start_codon:yes stop_codon:yes gene_type:complete
MTFRDTCRSRAIALIALFADAWALSLDPFALFDDGWSPAEVGVGGYLSW